MGKKRITYTNGESVGENNITFIKDMEGYTPRKALFLCSCGNEFNAVISEIKSNHTKSCGCLKRTILVDRNKSHGEARSHLHKVWVSMRQRCRDKNCKAYDNYGGRGIDIVREWDDFLIFKNWAMSQSYSSKLSLDRIDVNKGYSPENCRWVNKNIQMQNRRKNKNNTSGFKGVSFEIAQNKYSAKIMANGVKYFLGWFTSAVDAAAAYNNFVIENNLAHTLNKLGETTCV